MLGADCGQAGASLSGHPPTLESPASKDSGERVLADAFHPIQQSKLGVIDLAVRVYGFGHRHFYQRISSVMAAVSARGRREQYLGLGAWQLAQDLARRPVVVGLREMSDPGQLFGKHHSMEESDV